MEMKKKAKAVKHLADVAEDIPTCERPPLKEYLSKVKPTLNAAATRCTKGWKSMPPSFIDNCWRYFSILSAVWPATSAITSMTTNSSMDTSTGGLSLRAIFGLQLLTLTCMNGMLDGTKQKLCEL